MKELTPELTASDLGKLSQQSQRKKLGEKKYRALKSKYAKKRWKKLK